MNKKSSGPSTGKGIKQTGRVIKDNATYSGTKRTDKNGASYYTTTPWRNPKGK